MIAFDLHTKLCTDIKFAHKLNYLVNKIHRFHLESKTNPQKKKQMADAVLILLELTHYNLSPLVPFYFPRFDSGQPFSFKDYPFAMELYDVRSHQITTLRGSRQIGKCLSGNTLCKFRNKKTGDVQELTAEKAYTTMWSAPASCIYKNAQT